MIAIAFLFVRPLPEDIELMPQDQDFGFQPPSRLEAVPHPPCRLHLRWVDRALFIWLYRRCPRILDAVTIVRPETVVRVASNGLRRLLALEASCLSATMRVSCSRPSPAIVVVVAVPRNPIAEWLAQQIT